MTSGTISILPILSGDLAGDKNVVTCLIRMSVRLLEFSLLSSCSVWEQWKYGARRTNFSVSALYTPFSAFNARVVLAQNVRMPETILIPAPAHQTVGGPPAATPNLASYLHEHTSRQTSEHLSLLGTIWFAAQ